MHATDFFEELPRYGDWAPTGFDTRGLGLEDRQDWRVCPVSTNRDADTLTESNWITQLRILEDADPGGEYHEAHSFGHWACGWFEIVIVDPDAPEAVRVAVGEMAAALADHPVLDEGDFSEREWEAAQAAWEWLDLRDRIRLCADNGVSIFAARHETIPQEDPGGIYEYLVTP